MWCIVPAAGVGSRFGANKPKQYMELLPNTSILEYTLQKLICSNQFAGIIVTLNKDDVYWRGLDIFQEKNIFTCIGGESRDKSVLNGLKYLMNEHEIKSDEWVMVHDAARPGISAQLVQELYSQVISTKSCGGVLALPIADTIKQSLARNEIKSTVDRSCLWAAQTPQLFQLKTLMDAINYSQKNGYAITDEASAVENTGLNPLLVTGSKFNFKVTTISDYNLMKLLIQNNMA